MAARSHPAGPGHGLAAVTMPGTEVVRAYRFALDPSDAERATLSRYSGACRWAYNYAVAKKTQAHQAWADRRTAYLEAGLSEGEAQARIKADGAELTDRVKVWDHHRKSLTLTVVGKPPLPAMQPPAGQEALVRRLAVARADAAGTSGERELLAESRATVNALKAQAFTAGFRTPTATDTSALWRMERDLPREEGGSPWWREVNVYCFTSGFDRAQVAWKYWQDSLAGHRAGQRQGYPRFKKKGHTESFSLFHDVKRPIIRLEGYRRLVMPGLGSIRIHNSGKRLARLVERGRAVIQSVTVSRGGHRWYASVLAKVQQDAPVLWVHIHDDGTRTRYLSRTQAEKAAGNCGRVRQIGRPTARQRAGGLVGVDLGSHHLVALSSPLDPADPATALVPHPSAHRQPGQARQGPARDVPLPAGVGAVEEGLRPGLPHPPADHGATCLVPARPVQEAGHRVHARGDRRPRPHRSHHLDQGHPGQAGQERYGQGPLQPAAPGRRPGQSPQEAHIQDRLVRLAARRPRPGRARHRHLREVQGAKLKLRPIVQHLPLPLVRCGRTPTREQHREHRRRGAQETQDGRLR